MGTVIQLDDADFSNQDLPNIFPYIYQDRLSYAYDFRHGNFSDLVTGENLKGWLSNTTSHTTVSKSPAEITEASENGLYVRLMKDAALSTYKSIRDYEIGASQFSVVAVCGIPSDSDGTGFLPSFLDMGNGSGVLSGIPSIEARNSSIGIRARPSYDLDLSTAIVAGRLYFIALVFDGVNFTFINKTTGEIKSASLASLGITEMKATATQVDAGKHCIGANLNNNPLHDNPILIGQIAFWDNTAFYVSNIDDQYALMKQIYRDLI